MSERSRCLLRLGELIVDVEIAMLTTVRADGRLVSRPLRTLRLAAPFHGELWFFVRRDSHAAGEVAGETHVNLAYASRERNTYVSVSGRAKVVDNRAKVAELWVPELAAYFDGGPENREVVLLRVDVDGAEYWDGPGAGWLGQALDFAAGLVGSDPHPLTENRSIDLQHGH